MCRKGLVSSDEQKQHHVRLIVSTHSRRLRKVITSHLRSQSFGSRAFESTTEKDLENKAECPGPKIKLYISQQLCIQSIDEPGCLPLKKKEKLKYNVHTEAKCFVYNLMIFYKVSTVMYPDKEKEHYRPQAPSQALLPSTVTTFLSLSIRSAYLLTL